MKALILLSSNVSKQVGENIEDDVISMAISDKVLLPSVVPVERMSASTNQLFLDMAS
jgi:hypothetical protein